ncbi:MAG: putative metal-binding motif-containing protein [Sandaracinaceae bacterium]|nr:putative metal-binding motif-containing protein [Sandaracinaceae bacterium]
MTLLHRTARRRTYLLAALTATSMLAAAGCDGNDPMDAGSDDGGGMDAGPIDGSTAFPDGTVFCTEDSECDDDVDCTRDSCGPTGTCRNVVDPPSCDDGIFCNGVEQCDPRMGCVPGERETCNDDNVCTIDRCNEETKSCDRSPRDQDEDGDADWFCEGGTDCNDGDPSVSGLVNEVCDDFLDNDCDEMVDEADCGRPRYDTCDDPLDISSGGFYLLNTDGASPDYALSCRGTTRDLVAQFTLTERSSIDLEADGDFFTVALSLRTDCPSRDSELACESGFPGVIRRRSLDPGTYFVVLAASSTGEIGLTATFGPPIEPVTNDTCATPIDVSAGGTFMGSTVETSDAALTTCGFSGSPDLFYTFTTTTEQNVTISALSTTGESMTWEVADDCSSLATPRRCRYAAPASGTLHQLPPGTYILMVEGPSFRDVDFTLDVRFSASAPPPPGDTCADPITVPIDGTRVVGTLLDKEDDHDVSCGFRYRDAVYQFTLTTDSDVTVAMDAGSFGNISTRPTCTDSATQIRCTSGAPARQRIRNLAAGTYYVIAESSAATGFNLTVEATTPPTIATEVTGNENCMSARVIPPTGGLFHGNTTTMLPDLGGTTCGGGATSNDAVYQLTLTARSRVVASTEGSTFDTVLHVHQTSCTATGGDIYCDDDGGEGSTSLIDQMLDPGTYFIVVDGFGSTSAGEYYLEVMVTP